MFGRVGVSACTPTEVTMSAVQLALTPAEGPFHIDVSERFLTTNSSFDTTLQAARSQQLPRGSPMLSKSALDSPSRASRSSDAEWALRSSVPASPVDHYSRTSDQTLRRSWTPQEYVAEKSSNTAQQHKFGPRDSVCLEDPALLATLKSGTTLQWASATHFAGGRAEPASPSKYEVPLLTPRYIKEHEAFEIIAETRAANVAERVRQAELLDRAVDSPRMSSYIAGSPKVSRSPGPRSPH